MSSVQLSWISVPAFNVIRFLLLSVILIPLFEASIAHLFRIACALHLLRGKTAGWRESRLGYLSMHGKYYSRSSRALLYLISIATLAMYFILESSSSAELHPKFSTVEVRKTVALEAENADFETWIKLVRTIDHSSTQGLLAASIRHTGQRRGEAHKTTLLKKERAEVRNVTDYCFQHNKLRNNESRLQKWLDYLHGREDDPFWDDYDLFKLQNDFTSLYRAAFMGRDDSLLFTLDSEKLAIHLKAQFFAIGERRAEDSVQKLHHFYSRGTPLSSKEFLRLFGTLSVRTTVRRFVRVNRYVFSENRHFKCYWMMYQKVGGMLHRRNYALCRLSIPANRDGAFNTANILQEVQQWGDACITPLLNVNSGKCLSLLLRGTIVSRFDSSDVFTDVLLTDVLGIVEYNGRCVLDVVGEALILAGNEECRTLLNGSSVFAFSVGTLRRLMIRRIVLAEGGKAIARDGYKSVRLPLTAKVAPTVNVKFIAIICTVALFIFLQRTFVLALVFMNGKKRCLPRWAQLLITAQEVKVGDSFEYAARKATNIRESGDEESESTLKNEEAFKSDRALSLQRISGGYVVAIGGASATAWDYESKIL